AFAYLVIERGTILDPMSVSWAGYITCASGAMVATALLDPTRGYDAVKDGAMLCMVLALFGYLIGLYATRRKWLANRLPVPRSSLNMAEIWIMWLISMTVLGLAVAASPITTKGFAPVAKGLFDGSIGAATLLSVMVLISYRGQWVTKILMLLTLTG